LPVGRLTRTPNGEYPEYHSSADDLGFVTPAALADSYRAVEAILDVLDGNGTYVNQFPKCEPQLGKRGLYRATGGGDVPEREWSILWTLNLSDGKHSLLDIAVRSGLPFSSIKAAADELLGAKLLERST
jgi:aminopeptidase-like protein